MRLSASVRGIILPPLMQHHSTLARLRSTVARLAVAAALSAGCAPTALEVRPDDPASEAAPPAPLPEVAAALRGDPVPLAEHEEEGGHAHHPHHHRRAPAAEEDADASE